MTKIGRNDPCPRGSSKKYKRCCGFGPQPTTTGTRFSDRRTNLSTQADVPLMGLPGQRQHMISMFKFRSPEDPPNQIKPEGSSGEYRITFVFARPGYNLLPENQYSYATGLRGDSHLAITKPAFIPPGNPDATEIRIYGRIEDGSFTFRGLPNERGFLGKVESGPFKASTFSDAEEKAYRALASSLSNWSAHLDIPLHVHQIDSTHIESGNSRMSMMTAHWEAPFAVAPTAELKPEFRGYASLYREALGSSSDIYAYLCVFKILEGIQSRRKRLAIEAKNAGAAFKRPQRYVPSTPEEKIAWLNGIFPIRRNWDAMALDSIFPAEVLGKRFGYVITTVLTPLRVDIAHALSLESGELTMSVDDLLHTQKVNKWLPLTKCIVRRMLKDEFPNEYLPYLKEDGTVVT
jgi:methylamine utilization protein MauJ/SEC-C motif-containing protein